MATAELQTGMSIMEMANGHTADAEPHLADEIDAPVLVVGGGPTGLLSAYMLAKLGGGTLQTHPLPQSLAENLPLVRCLLIEKYPSRLAAPKAHALCPRSLEICRQFLLDTNKMRKLGSQRGDAYWVNFVTNLSGERIGVLPYERMDTAVLDCTPEASRSGI